MGYNGDLIGIFADHIYSIYNLEQPHVVTSEQNDG